MPTLDFYHRHYFRLAPVLLDLMRHGVKVNRPFMAAKYAELRVQCTDIQYQLDDLVGAFTCTCTHHRNDHAETPAPPTFTRSGALRKRQPKPTYPCATCTCTGFEPSIPSLHAEKDLSSQAVVNYLYHILKLPKQRKKGEDGSLTADEVALRKLRLKVASTQPMVRPTPRTEPWKTQLDQVAQVLDLLLDHREKAKLSTYMDTSKVDPDGRLRCMYKVTTENGRLASAKNPMGTGFNLQNPPRVKWVRSCFEPDEGCLLMEVDFSQIESRIVKVKSGDPEAIRQARLRPDEWDDHSEGARRIFSRILNIPPADVDVNAIVVPGTSRRQLAKPVRHGINFGEGPAKIQDALLKDQVVLPLDLCEQLLTAGREAYVLAYQALVRRLIMRQFRLTNSWGRVLDFTGCRLNDETYRRGYAFWAASENGDDLNQLGLYPTHRWLQRNAMRSHINLQVHDSLVISVWPEEAWSVLSFVVATMEQERVYEGVPLSVPVEIKLGTTWNCEQSYKAIPTHTQLDTDIRKLLDIRRAA